MPISRAIPIVNPAGRPANGKERASPSTPSTPTTFAKHSSTKDTDAPTCPLDIYAKAFVPEAFRIINELTPIWQHEVPNPRAIDYFAYVGSFGALPYLQNRPLHENARYNCLGPSRATFETPVFLEYESAQSIPDDYERHFECLIGREFAHHRAEHRLHSLYNKELKPYLTSMDLFTLEWPGVLEETPYIQAGDCVQLRQLTHMETSARLNLMDRWIHEVGRPHLKSGRADPPCPLPPGWTGRLYTVRVHAVINAREIVILYAPGLQGQEFNVVLPVSKRPYEARLNAVAHFARLLQSSNNVTPQVPTSHSWARKMLFPEPNDGAMQNELEPLPTMTKWFDGVLNFEQKKAIRSIWKRNYGTVPYLISGPPGTGKTKTLVETALQLIQLPQTSHILVCAPSNAAADTLAARLSEHLDPHQLLRLNAPKRNIIEVPYQIRKYCCSTVNEVFALPDFRRLMGFRVVVSSCQDASLLVRACLTNSDLFQFEHGVMTSIHPTAPKEPHRLHWGALLLDEAAQAVEPEAIIPLSVITPPPHSVIVDHPLLIMAGDENQLGPRTYSHHPRLKTSLFARLFKRPIYASHPLARGNRRALERNMLPILRPPFTNLIRNYRSHPAILAFPSAAFYADTLFPCSETSDRLTSLDLWRGRRWPVLFVSNPSNEDLDENDGGWYNAGEARKALSIAQQVLSSGLVIQEDICIMSPFAVQVRLLRKVCRDQNLWKINIGPCEAFQGLESRFVILCTTRARERFLGRDVEVCKGLIRQPQRMNVCLTRTQHGLVVIGNPEVLSVDVEWVRFMAFCKRNGLVEGQVNIPDSPDEILQLERVLLAQDRDAAGVKVTTRPLGVRTGEDRVWERGMAAEEVVRQEEVREGDGFGGSC